MHATSLAFFNVGAFTTPLFQETHRYNRPGANYLEFCMQGRAKQNTLTY